MACSLPFFLLCSFLFFVAADNISTSIPVPPLQWINLSHLTQGSAGPPPLRDASVGYDENRLPISFVVAASNPELNPASHSQSLIVFGGLSESGVAQSQTYLLNLRTLTWSTPSPPPNLQSTPPARSLALSGTDFAASNRHGFVVIGGKDLSNQALSDVWEYDFNNQFWSPVTLSPGGPSARWGASGGIDVRTASISDPTLPGPNNTFFLAGGFNGKTQDRLSDVWSMSLSGTLSSNMPDSVNGSWDTSMPVTNLPGRVGQGGTVISQQIISMGGCNSSATLSAMNTSCAEQGTFIVNLQAQTTISPAVCPAPRVAPVLIPNMNTFTTAFASQVLLVLGSFNTSLWQDSDGLSKGEVAILDINTGVWTRVLPSGDPSSSSQFPSPRQGAAAVSSSKPLVGGSQTGFSDSLIFGGQDDEGNILSELWLLRAYSGILTPANSTFAGGQLRSGVDADGSGVQMDFLTTCASLNAVPTKPRPKPTTSSTKSTNKPSSTGGSPSSSATIPPVLTTFETSFPHKLLLPISVILLTAAVLFLRWTQDSQLGWLPTENVYLFSVFILMGAVSYGLGVVGFVLAFTSISSSIPSKNSHLKTGHGIAGLIFFACLYIVMPLLYLLLLCHSLNTRSSSTEHTLSETGRTPSLGTNEKRESLPMRARSNTPSLLNTSPPSTPRPRAMSWDASVKLKPTSVDEGGVSSESPSSSTPTPHAGFEVLNRGKRARKLSEPWEASTASGTHGRVPSTRRLGEIDWLLRRRSLNAVGELDYAITQAHNTKYLADANRAPEAAMELATVYPPTHVILFHVFLHISILGICGVILAALWLRARRYWFVLFLLWTLGFYAAIFVLSWLGRPVTSFLTVTLWRIRGYPITTSVARSDLVTDNLPQSPQVGGSSRQGPYTHHRPPVRTSTQRDDMSYIRATPLSVRSDDDDNEDIDEDTRQRLIEEEMERREVSIVTVPRRKLYLTNPS